MSKAKKVLSYFLEKDAADEFSSWAGKQMNKMDVFNKGVRKTISKEGELGKKATNWATKGLSNKIKNVHNKIQQANDKISKIKNVPKGTTGHLAHKATQTISNAVENPSHIKHALVGVAGAALAGGAAALAARRRRKRNEIKRREQLYKDR